VSRRTPRSSGSGTTTSRAAGKRRAEYGTRYYPELTVLLDAVEAVGITSETAKHAPLVESAAAAGVDVLCEKPIARTLEECDRIERAVARSGIRFMQNFPKRYDPAHRELVELVRRGDLGRVVLARVRHGHAQGVQMEFRRQWFVASEPSGGGTLLDEGIHAADLLLWMLGRPAAVGATTSRAALGLDVEDTAVALLRFPDGALAEVATSWVFHAAEQSVEVFGTRGSAILSGVDLASREFATAPFLRVFREGAPRGAWTASPTTPYFQQGVTHRQGPLRFIAAVRGGTTPWPGLAEGRAALEVIAAAYRAAASGQAQILGGGV